MILIADKLFKGVVVTTKPRRSRRGRGAAAIKTETCYMGGLMTPLGGRAVCAGQESFAT